MRLPLVLLWLCAPSVAQAPERLVADLRGDDEVAVERAFRLLWELPRDQVPAAALAAVGPGPGEPQALALLRHHGLPLPALVPGKPPLPRARLLLLDNAALQALVADQEIDSEIAAAVLDTLQRRGALDEATMVAALTSDHPTLPVVAAAILRHEWVRIPAGLLVAVRKNANATELLLRGLALAPRPALVGWAEACMADTGLPADVRCLALAATGRVLTRKDLDLPFLALQEERVGDGYHLALALLPSNVADTAVAAVHARLQAGVPIDRLRPFFDRLSPAGQMQLLGLVGPLPAELRDELCQLVASRDSGVYHERVRAALDGEIPLESHWLLRAGPLLDRPERVDRVVAVLADDQAEAAARLRAFDALVDARRFVPAMEPFLQADPVPRLRRVLAGDVEVVPEALLLAALATPDVRSAAVSALVRRELTPALTAAVAELLGLADGRRDVEGVRRAAVMTLALRGGEDAVTAMWERLRGDQVLAVAAAEFLGRRKEPFVHALMLAELARDPARLDEAELAYRDELLDHVRVSLIELGDRRQLRELVANAARHRPAFLRRCRHVVPDLPVAEAQQLFAMLAQVDDDEMRVELASWAGGCRSPVLTAELRRLWQVAEAPEVQDAALRGLMAGPGRDELVDELRAAMAAGALDDRMSAVAFETIATMPTPLSRADCELLAELCLLAPLRSPADELRRACMFPEGRTGFPQVAAVAERLRQDVDGTAVPAFATAAATALGAPGVAMLARQRLLCLWTGLVAMPAQQRAIAMATAALLPRIPDVDDRGGGVAAHWLALAALQRGEPAVAATHARAAVAGLLRGGEDGISIRVFLGERDPAGGSDPFAAVAARPWLCDALAARAAGDVDAARKALVLAREFAGRDAAMLASIQELTVELPK